MVNDKDEMLVTMMVALNALANEAVAYVRDKNSDGRFLIAAADKASLVVQAAARQLHGGTVQ